MPHQNVDLIHRITEASNAGDVEAVLADMHPEVDFVPLRAPVQGSYRGYEGMREFFADNVESFDVFRTTVEEIRDLGDTAVVVTELTVQGKGSGAAVTVPNTIVLRFRDGKVIYFKAFTDKSEAFAAAGLKE